MVTGVNWDAIVAVNTSQFGALAVLWGVMRDSPWTDTMNRDGNQHVRIAICTGTLYGQGLY